MEILLVIDAGTLSMKAALCNLSGKILYLAIKKYVPNYLNGGKVEQNPDIWRHALIDLVLDCQRYASERAWKLSAIGLTSQRSSLIPTDCKGDPLCDAIMWLDGRAAALCKEMREQEAFLYSRTGLRPTPVFGAPKMKWLKENCRELYDKAEKLTAVPDFLLHFMTGKFVTDDTYASRSMLKSLSKQGWDSELIQLFGLDCSKLSEILPVGSICGYTTAAFSSLTHVLTGTPVITCGGDQQCSLLSLSKLCPRTVGITVGTGAFICCFSNAPYFASDMRFECSPAAIPNLYQIECNIASAGAFYELTNQLLFSKDKGNLNLIDHGAKQSPAGANGLIFSLPSSVHSTAQLSGIHLNMTAGDISRSILEGIVYEIQAHVTDMERRWGRFNEYRLGGGVTRFSLFNQMVSDFMGRPIHCCNDENSTIFGGWAQMAVAICAYPNAATALAQLEDSVEEIIPQEDNSALYSNLIKQRELKLEV